MALKGTITGTTDNKYAISKIVWSAERNIEENYSTITAKLYYSRTNSFTSEGIWKGTISIGTNTYTGSSSGVVSVSKDSNTFVAEHIAKVYHSNDGTLSITISATGGINGSSITKTINCSSTVTIDAIERNAKISSASDIILGNNCNIKWKPTSSSHHYSLKFSIGEWKKYSADIFPNTTNEYTYSDYIIPVKDIAELLPNSLKGTMNVTLFTFSDSEHTKQIGYTSLSSFTVSIPSDVIPTLDDSLNVSMVNSNSVIDSWRINGDKIAVAGYTRFKIEATAKGAYGSTIESYTITGAYEKNENSVTLDYTGGVITSSGSKSFNVKAKDSRNRESHSDWKTFWVYPYSKPQINSFSVERDNENAKKIIVGADWEYSLKDCNEATATLYYKSTDSEEWNLYGEISPNIFTTLDENFEEGLSYNFKLIVRDSLSEFDVEDGFISTIAVLMDFRAGGKGLGIGKMCESDSMEVALIAKFFNDIYINGDKLIDYIIGEGIVDGWNYKKWSSGKYECWKIVNVGEVTFTANGNVYVGSFENAIYYPETLSSIEDVQITSLGTGYTFFSPTNEITKTNIPGLSFMATTARTLQNIKVAIHIIGRGY